MGGDDDDDDQPVIRAMAIDPPRQSMIGLGENRRRVDRGPRRGHGARLRLFRIFRLDRGGEPSAANKVVLK